MNRPKTVLIIDDSEFDRLLMMKMLSQNPNIKILCASNGAEGLELIKSNKIDLVLLDIMMPGNFGPQILREIRQNSNPIELPVIMVSGKDDTTDIIGSLHLGASDYIVKPFSFDIALSRIATHLRLSELSSEMVKHREIAALCAMVATYNHEINNPLTMALACLDAIKKVMPNNEEVNNAQNACWRIADIVKGIEKTLEGTKVDLEVYAGSTKMVKIKK